MSRRMTAQAAQMREKVREMHMAGHGKKAIAYALKLNTGQVSGLVFRGKWRRPPGVGSPAPNMRGRRHDG